MTDRPTVITNHVPRFTVDAYELTPREREQFVYLDESVIVGRIYA